MLDSTDTSLGVLQIERTFAAPIEAVFAAFTNPDQMSRWFFGFPGGSARIEQDFRVGGRYLIEMHPPEDSEAEDSCCANSIHYGEYLEIEPPRRLAFTWINDGFVRYSEVVIEFEATTEGTRLKLTHRVPAETVEAHERGWGACLDNLLIFLKA